MKALNDARAIGYEAQLLPDGKVRLFCREGCVPDPAAAVPILEELRAHRDDVVRHLRAEAEEGRRIYYKAAVRQIDDVLLHGLLSHLARRHPDTWPAVLRAEDDVDATWKACEAGTAGEERFKATVDTWRDRLLSACHEHRRRTCAECPPDKALACWEATRERDRRVSEGKGRHDDH